MCCVSGDDALGLNSLPASKADVFSTVPSPSAAAVRAAM